MIVDSNDLGQELLGKSDGIFFNQRRTKRPYQR